MTNTASLIERLEYIANKPSPHEDSPASEDYVVGFTDGWQLLQEYLQEILFLYNNGEVK